MRQIKRRGIIFAQEGLRQNLHSNPREPQTSEVTHSTLASSSDRLTTLCPIEAS